MDEIIMDGSDDDLGFDDEIEINEDDDGKVAKMEITIKKYEYCLHSTTTVVSGLLCTSTGPTDQEEEQKEQQCKKLRSTESV